MTITIDSEVDSAIEQLIADLRGARDIIAENGLAKEKFFDVFQNNSPTCAVGAVLRQTGHDTDHKDAPRVMRAVYALAVTLGKTEPDIDDPGLYYRSELYDFNDHADTTQDDILGLFDTAIARLSE